MASTSAASYNPTRDDFAAMLDESFAGGNLQESSVIKGTVVAIEKDMAVIDVGLKTEGRVALREFAGPGRESELKVGDEVEVFLDRIENALGEAVLSRDKARREESWGKLEKAFQNNEKVSGVIFNQVKGGFTVDLDGALVDLGGIDGLLHVTDIAWRRVNHPTEVLTIGQTVKVKIIKINHETHRISLGMKQLLDDPWQGIEAKYPLNARFTGRVTNITDYGAFVELEPGIEGLIHVSEMSWTKKNMHPGKIVSTSQEVEVQVLEVDSVKRRISLGLKQTMRNPWEVFVEKFPVGSTVEGEVKNKTEFGLFLGLDGDVDGMVHLSDLDWKLPGEQVIDNDKKARKVQVSIKALEVAEEKEAIAQYGSSDSGATLGDILGTALKNRDKKD